MWYNEQSTLQKSRRAVPNFWLGRLGDFWDCFRILEWKVLPKGSPSYKSSKRLLFWGRIPGQQSSHLSLMPPVKVYETDQSWAWHNTFWDKNMCCRYIKSLSFKFPKESIQNLKCILRICEAIEMSWFITFSSRIFFLIHQNLMTFW